VFVPPDFDVPLSLETPDFVLRPLTVEYNEADHEAWMSSIDHIRATPGFPDGRWPRPMTLEENARDLARHADDFAARRGFTYTVLRDDEVIGCVYIYPDGVRSWVRASHASLDHTLYDVVRTWLDSVWSFDDIGYSERRM
jgi:RimJ/RimL family protein N-acetyltransferase